MTEGELTFESDRPLREEEIEAVGKRPAFLEALEHASTLEDVRKAVHDFAVLDPQTGEKIVINFFVGALKDKNEPDGADRLADIEHALDEFKTSLPKDDLFEPWFFNYSIESALTRILKLPKFQIPE